MKKNYFKSLAQVAILLCAPLFIASCDEFGTEDNPAGAYPSINTADVTIKVGETFTRTAIAASAATVEYTSMDEKIATVELLTGKVTGVADGRTVIVAKPYFAKDGGKLYTGEEVKYSITVQDPESKFAYNFGEAGVPKLIYAGTKVEIVPVAPQKNVGVLGFTFEVKKSNDNGTTWVNVVADTEGKFFADAAGLYKVTATSVAYKSYVTSNLNTTADYTVEVLQAYAYTKWDANEKKLVNDTILASDLKGVYPGGSVPGAVLPEGTYVITGDATLDGTLQLKGDVNFIVKDGVTLTINSGGFDEEDPAAPHVLNIFKGVGTGTSKINANVNSGDVFKNLKEINTYGVDITANTSVVNCGGFTLIGAINIYAGDVVATNTGTSGFGVKMKTGGEITVNGGSFTATGKGTDADYSKAVIGKLACATGYKFQDSADGTTWADMTGDTTDKLYVKSVAPAP